MQTQKSKCRSFDFADIQYFQFNILPTNNVNDHVYIVHLCYISTFVCIWVYCTTSEQVYLKAVKLNQWIPGMMGKKTHPDNFLSFSTSHLSSITSIWPPSSSEINQLQHVALFLKHVVVPDRYFLRSEETFCGSVCTGQDCTPVSRWMAPGRDDDEVMEKLFKWKFIESSWY